MKRQIIPLFILGLTVFLSNCSPDSAETKTGTYINVFTLDNDQVHTPITGTEVTLAPINTVLTTDENGKCSFMVVPGDYVIQASLCCVGPGYIQYKDSVTVTLHQTVTDTLFGCLTCE